MELAFHGDVRDVERALKKGLAWEFGLSEFVEA